MSNFCQILIEEDFDFGVDKTDIIEYLKEKKMYQWDKDCFIFINFSREDWKDVIYSLTEKFGWFFDFIYVRNDCFGDCGIFRLNGNMEIEKCATL